MKMEICFFGTYEKNYPSNRIIIKGLRRNGINVKECHISLWEKHKNKHGRFLNAISMIFFAIEMILAYIRLGTEYVSKYRNSDVVIIGYIGQIDIIFFKMLSLFFIKKPKIVFAPLVSLYDTAIVDRNLSAKKGMFSKLLFLTDKFSFKLADIIIFDTNEHIKYISELFGADKSKLKRVWVGADEEVFYPAKRNADNQEFTVLFFGKYIPLHGIEFILHAAKLLEKDKVRFRMVGSGQLYEEMLDLSEKLETKNVDFAGWMGYNELLKEINKADLVLGIFGGSDKASRVIPNKIFQAIACGKAVVTGRAPAVEEAFTNGVNIVLCENRNPQSLAEKISGLKNDRGLKKRIEEGAYSLFKNNFSSQKIGRLVKNLIVCMPDKQRVIQQDENSR